jgi:hypothetical protein
VGVVAGEGCGTRGLWQVKFIAHLYGLKKNYDLCAVRMLMIIIIKLLIKISDK